VIGEGIFAQDDEEEGVPPSVVVGDAIQDDGHEHLDVKDGDGGGVDVGVLGLVLIEGLGTGGSLPVALLLGLPGGALSRGLRHSWGGGRKPAAAYEPIGSRPCEGGAQTNRSWWRQDRRPGMMATDRSGWIGGQLKCTTGDRNGMAWRRACGTSASGSPATEGGHGVGARVRPASVRPSDGGPASVALGDGEAPSVVRTGGG
jgi:hypothetical protein